MITVQSKQGFVILVSEKNPPVTNVFRLTINTLVGEEIFRVNHREIEWINHCKKEKRALWKDPSKKKKDKCPTNFSNGERAACMIKDEWFHDGANQQSSSIVDFDGKQPRYEGYASTEYNRTYYKRGRNDKYKDHGLRASGSTISRASK